MPATPITPQARFTHRQDLLERQCLDGLVIYDPAREKVHVLNDAARFVWEQCAAGKTVAEIVAFAAGAAEIDVARAAADIRGALRVLLDQGLVHEA
jgi:hypothetical protein